LLFERKREGGGTVEESGTPMGMEHAAAMEESPYRMPSRKLGMWLFIMSDAVTFSAVLFAYGFVRVGAADWPRPFESSSIANGIVMTVVLLVSSFTMLAALDGARQGNKGRCTKWMVATLLLGLLFAGLHLMEWLRMIGEGWRLFQNPTGGPAIFGATFFCVTGLHLLHILSGVVAVAVVAIKYNQARLGPGHVESVGLYWHFVDVVWMFVFPLIYLMNAK
jgi:cytochrome c oxidase subunit III